MCNGKKCLGKDRAPGPQVLLQVLEGGQIGEGHIVVVTVRLTPSEPVFNILFDITYCLTCCLTKRVVLQI